MTATVFVDTNVLVYARDASEVDKQPQAEAVELSGAARVRCHRDRQARAAGCRFLLTEDVQHGQVVGDLTVLSPFELSPDALPAE